MSQGRITGREAGLVDPKFDIALNLRPARRLLQRMRDREENKTITLIKRVVPNWNKLEVDVRVIGFLLENMFQYKQTYYDIRLIQSLKVSLACTRIQEFHLFQYATENLKKELVNFHELDSVKLNSLPTEIKLVHDAVCEIDQSFEHFQKISFMGDEALESLKLNREFVIHSLNCKFVMIRNYVICYLGYDSFLLTKDQFFMIHNKVFEIFNVIILSYFLSGVCWGSNFYSRCINILRLMISHVIKMGNRSYDLFKSFDGIATALVMLANDKFPNVDPLQFLQQSILDEKICNHVQLGKLIKLFGDGDQETIELSGLSKLVGHPDINTLEGVIKLRSRTMEPIDVTAEKTQELLNNMKKRFCEQFLRRHRRWPDLDLTALSPYRFWFCIMNRKWIDDTSIPANIDPITLKDWSTIEICQIITFDQIISQFHFLKDTALAFKRSYLDNENLRRRITLSDKRTLLYFLMEKDPPLQVENYMYEFIQSNPGALEYQVIKLTQKERELKREGRFFGQSPYVERARRCVLEENLAQIMEKYNSSQAMTLSELDKMRKMYTLCSGPELNSDDFYIVKFSMDVEAFNNRFRRSFCEPIGREFFDKLFGVHHYQKFMHIFEQSKLIVTDGIEEFSWQGQFGGIEGLAQKAWTWVYESVASRVAEGTGYQHYLLVNGDDLRVIFHIPKKEIKEEHLLNTLKRISSDFEREYEQFGFKLKLQESYYSEALLGFSKNYMVNRAWMTCTLKKGAKIHGLANLLGDLPLEYLKGVMSETVSTCGYSVNHRFIYSIGLCVIQFYLHKYVEKQFKQLSEDQQVFLLMFPSCLGGIPVLPYLRCLTKGDSDLLTVWISLWKYVSSVSPEDTGNLINYILDHTIDRSRNYSLLASNAYSLPLKTPKDGLSLLRENLQQSLINIIKNKKFLEVMKFANKNKVSRFIKSLYSTSVIPGKAFSVIYETSPAGLLDEMSMKFTSSRSISEVITKDRGHRATKNLLRRARRTDIIKMIVSIKLIQQSSRLMENPGFSLIFREGTCPTQVASDIRRLAWNREITGVTYPCFVDQWLFGRTERNYIMNDPYPGATPVTLHVYPTKGTQNLCYEHGPEKMFLGSMTGLRVLPPNFRFRGTSPGISRIKKLLQLYPMMKKLGPQIEEYCNQSLSQLTGLPAETLTASAWQVQSGSVAHRVPANHWSPLVGPNEFSNRSTFTKGSLMTNIQGLLRSGDWTVNLNYNKSIEICIALYRTEFYSTQTILQTETYLFYEQPCDYCFTEVTDTVVWTDIPPPLFEGIDDNPYVGFSQVDKENLSSEFHIQLVRKKNRFIKNLSQSEADRIYAFRTVCRSFFHSYRRKFIDESKPLSVLNTYSEEDNCSLYMISSLRAIGLTELKKIPPYIFEQEFLRLFIAWVCEKHPEYAFKNRIHHLATRHRLTLPFNEISSALINSAYWPVFRSYLEREKNWVESLGNNASPTDVSFALVSYCIEAVQSFIEIIPTNIIIPVTLYPSDDELMDFCSNRLRIEAMIIIYRYIHSQSFSRFKWLLENKRFNKLKFFFVSMYCVNLLPFDVTIEMKRRRVFSIKPIDGQILNILLRSCLINGVDRKRIITTYQRYFQHLEKRRNFNFKLFLQLVRRKNWISQLTKYTYQLEYTQLDRATKLVRESHNKEYEEYHRRLIGSNLLTPEVIWNNPRDYYGFECRIFTVRLTIDQNRILSDTQVQRINNLNQIVNVHVEKIDPLTPSILTRLFGARSSACVKLYCILKCFKFIARDSGGTILTTCEGGGGFSRVLLQMFPKIRVVFNTLPEEATADIQNFPTDCQTLSQPDLKRFSHKSFRNGIGDLVDPATVEHLLNEIGSDNLIMITCDSQYHWKAPEINAGIWNSLLELINRKLIKGGSVIIKLLWIQRANPLKKIIELQNLFNRVFVCRPISVHERSYEIYLVAIGYRNCGGFQSFINEHTIDDLYIISNYIDNKVNDRSHKLPISPHKYLTFHHSCMSNLGLLNIGIFTSSLQSLAIVFRQQLIRCSFNVLTREVNNICNLQRAELLDTISGLRANEKRRTQHLLRLWCEIVTLQELNKLSYDKTNYVNLLTSYSSTIAHVVEIFSNNEVENMNISQIVSDEWINNTFLSYSSILIRFLLYLYLYYTLQ